MSFFRNGSLTDHLRQRTKSASSVPQILLRFRPEVSRKYRLRSCSTTSQWKGLPSSCTSMAAEQAEHTQVVFIEPPGQHLRPAPKGTFFRRRSTWKACVHLKVSCTVMAEP